MRFLPPIFRLSLGLFLLLPMAQSNAHGSKTDAALSLLHAPGARAAALGEAFSAAQDDGTAAFYNPSLLSTLQSNDASFLFQRGATDDAFGQVQLGLPIGTNKGLGVIVGYYDGGDAALFDQGEIRSANSQKDLLMQMGFGINVGRLGLGVTGKYFSSTLAEQARADAIALDLGLNGAVTSRLKWGMAVQNLGTQMNYGNESEPLPRILRAGFSYALISQGIPTQLLFDLPYHFNQDEFRPGIGIEVQTGPLAFRSGYKGEPGLERITFGAGFLIGPTHFDYAFGLVDQLDNQHDVSVSMRFGNRNAQAETGSQP